MYRRNPDGGYVFAAAIELKLACTLEYARQIMRLSTRADLQTDSRNAPILLVRQRISDFTPEDDVFCRLGSCLHFFLLFYSRGQGSTSMDTDDLRLLSRQSRGPQVAVILRASPRRLRLFLLPCCRRCHPRGGLPALRCCKSEAQILLVFHNQSLTALMLHSRRG